MKWIDLHTRKQNVLILNNKAFGWCEKMKDVLGVGFDHMLLVSRRSVTTFWVYKTDLEKINQALRTKLFADVVGSKSMAMTGINRFQELIDYLLNLIKKDLTHLSGEELATLIQEYFEKQMDYLPFLLLPTFVDDIFVTEIQNYLDKHVLGDEREKPALITDYLNILTTLNEESYATKAEKELLEMAQDLATAGVTSEDIEIEQERDSEIRDNLLHYTKKWEWLPVQVAEPAYDFDHFITEIKKLLDDNEGTKKRLAEIVDHLRSTKDKKKQIFESVQFDENHRRLVDVFQQWVYLKDFRRSIISQERLYARKLYTEIARRLNLSSTEVPYLMRDELISAIRGEASVIDTQAIRDRMEMFIVSRDENGVEIITGDSAEKIISKELSGHESPKENLLKGVCASPGKASGKAKIVLGVQDASKVESGDILIAIQTTPDLLGAMKKSAAVVTEEGGLLCHAAIVSRELKIPCIVGVKKATDILKDGDLVEMDADVGSLKKGQSLGDNNSKDDPSFSDEYEVARNRWYLPVPASWYSMANVDKRYQKLYGEHLPSFYQYFVSGELIAFRKKSEWDRLSAKIADLAQKKPEYLNRMYHNEVKKGRKLSRYANHIFSSDFGHLPIRKLLNYYEQLRKYWIDYNVFFMPVWFVAGDEIKKDIEAGLRKYKNISEDKISLLLRLKDLSLAAQEEKAVYEAAAKILLWSEGGRQQKILREAAILSQHFGWIPVSYDAEEYWDVPYYIQRIGAMIDLGVNSIQDKLHELRKQKADIVSGSNSLRKKYRFSRKELQTLALFQNMCRAQDERKHFLSQAHYSWKKLALDISKVSGLKFVDLKYLMLEELREILPKTERLESIAIDRRKNSMLAEGIFPNNIFVRTGAEAVVRFNSLIRKAGPSLILKGNVASMGGKKEITGKVRVMLSPSQVSEMKEGEVLVTRMTSIEFISAVRLASAVITDEGGATCHAAIICRELNTPCITATKNATSMLESGKEVRLDLETGIITRL